MSLHFAKESWDEFAHIAGVLTGRHGLTRRDLTSDTDPCGQKVYLPTYGIAVYVKKARVKNHIQAFMEGSTTP